MAATSGPDGKKPAELACGDWTPTREPKKRRCPIADPGGVPLRLLFDREAYAEVVQHAKESLEAEICGVLVGAVNRDDAGLWVEVSAAIRGHAAARGASHVTFTQETINQIHAEKERRFPAAAIVGWYHSHPGFGVEFSEMDTFIHRNFFNAPAQVALLTDPVGGDDAACINQDSGTVYLDRCWVDGRERRLRLPGEAAKAGPGGAGQARIDALEARVAQLVGTLDDLRERIWSFYLVVGMTVVILLVAWLGWQMWGMWAKRHQPPEVMNEFSLPVRVGDKDVIMLGRIYGWEVPPELNSLMLQEIERVRKEAEAKAEEARQRAAEQKGAAQPPPTANPEPPR